MEWNDKEAPSENGTYLVTGMDKNTLRREVYITIFTIGKGFYRVKDNDNIIAWMKLPEVYKGE